MKKSQDLSEMILDIVSKAATLRDKIENRNKLLKGEGSGQADQQTKEWKIACALDDHEIFARRLFNDDLNESEAEEILSGQIPFSLETMPPWSHKFHDILDSLLSESYERQIDESKALQNNEMFSKIPFLHLLIPFVRVAFKDLEGQVSLNHEIIGEKIQSILNQQLFGILSIYFSQTFQLEFSIFRRLRQSPIERLVELNNDASADRLYLSFVKEFYEGKWKSFFTEYAPLAKIVTLLSDYWVTNTSELLKRVIGDYSKIRDHFSPLKSPGKLVEISAGVSDSHNHGKRVYILKFESGLKVVYKPKDLTLEQAYSNLLKWFNNSGILPELKPLDVLCCGDYGWVGYIEANECTSGGQIKNYYRRIGMLICIVYLLKGNDCHYENLIACGEHPVIIDLESIMHHTSINMVDESVESAIYQTYEQFGTSVFRTGLLPSWNVGKDDYTFDISAMGADGKHETPYRWIKWKDVNSDRMEIVLEKVILPEYANIPRLKGKRYLPFGYEDKIEEGFTSLYKYILENRALIPIDQFADKDVRFIFRNTKVYSLISKKLLNPKFMRLGIDRSIQMEVLCRAFLHNEGKSNFWNILKSEIRQMEDLDIPIFTSNSSGRDLCTGNNLVKSGFMEEAVYDQVSDRLNSLCQDDLKNQIKFIRASLFFRNIDETHSEKSEKGLPIQREKLKPASREQLIVAARDIGDKIIKEAIFSDDGTASWITVGIIPGSEKLQMRPMSISIYDGLGGIAMFYGALYKVTGDLIYRKFAIASLRSIQRSVEGMRKYSVMININPLGIAVGLSSIIYTLEKLIFFLDDPSLIRDAEFIAGKIGPELIEKDRYFDILSGSAGAILALLQLYDLTQKDEYLKNAIACGEILVKKKTYVAKGMCGWKNMEDKPLAGFSHGNAGIVYSLLKLFDATANNIFYQTAIEAIDYENSLYQDSNKNWEDMRAYSGTGDMNKPKFMTSWCHGAPGIALSRLASKYVVDNKQITTDIRNALSTTKEFPLDQIDHLCCGNMGRVETLFYASRILKDPELELMAYQNAAYIIEKSQTKGQYSLFHNTSGDLFNPGFFQGLSGIGYEFIRLAYPDIIPSVLIFE